MTAHLVSRITKYSEDYVRQLTVSFLKRFNSDKRPFSLKLKEIHMSKGGYSHLINHSYVPQKRTLETMRAYLEGRSPKWTLVKEGEGYCSSCEGTFPLSQMKQRWTCILCKNEINYKSKMRTGLYARNKITRRIKYWGLPLEDRVRILKDRKKYRLRKNYGKFFKCVELVQRLKQEIRHAEQES